MINDNDMETAKNKRDNNLKRVYFSDFHIWIKINAAESLQCTTHR